MGYHWSNPLLAVGSVIEPGNYGRILTAAGYSHNHALRESVLEHVRSIEFPNSPSRFSSTFFFETQDQAIQYANDNQFAFVNLYEVELADMNAPIVDVDHRRISPLGAVGFEWARAYWRGDPWPGSENPHLFRERLTTSPLRIVRRVQP